MNAEKSFVTCFDKDCEEYAETLMTLVSKDKTLMNIKRELEEFKKDRGVVSGEYVLTIGKKGSTYNRRNFKDIYNNYGIHIGYYGAKAWLYCEKFKWDLKSQFDFNKELFFILEELGMKTDDFDDKVQELYKKYKTAAQQEKTIKDGEQRSDNPSGMDAPVLHLEINKVLESIFEDELRIPIFLFFTRRMIKNAKRRKKQYLFAIVLFYHHYIHDFLGIKEEQNDEQNY